MRGGNTISRGLEPLEDAVSDFHTAFGAQVGDKRVPTALDDDQHELRHRLLTEELDEFELARYGKTPLVDMVDACADLIYLAVGALVAMGVEPGPILEEVHRSNMTKLGIDGRPILRADGKIIKGPHYEPPDIAGALDAQVDWHNLPPDDSWGEGETLF